ncbi:DUF805 domain-containing protein [bacterium]|nr:DUF805 domain-containing protein [bacterium]
MNAITGCLSNMFNIEGRTSQIDYIIFFIFCIIVSALCGGAIYKFCGETLGYIVCLLLFVIPMITATIRRLRDAGLTPWLALLLIFQPLGLILEIILCLLPAK